MQRALNDSLPANIAVQPAVQSLIVAPADRVLHALKVPRVVAGFTVLLGGVFCFLCFQPLWHTDLWSHLQYGQIMWTTGAIPSHEPMMPLAAEKRLVDTAWLTQLVAHGFYTTWNLAGLQFLYAVSITMCFVLLLVLCYRKTDSVALSLGGLAAFGWLNWQQFLVIRPQLAGLVCFMVLLSLTVGRQWRRANWVAIPLLCALWANMHGSFIIGLVLLSCFVVGRMVDIYRRRRRFGSVVRDHRVRRLLLLLGLAAVAGLVNPYGIDLYAHVLMFSQNANLSDLVEWGPLTVRSSQGTAAAVITVLLTIVYRLSPRRVSAGEVIALVVLGGCALWTSRMLVWWSPPAAYYLVVHAGATLKRFRRNGETVVTSPRSIRWSMATLAAGWIFFGVSPFGAAVLYGERGKFEQSVSKYTPVAAAEFLRNHPPGGQIFNSYEWGDFLSWSACKHGQVLNIFVASHAHLVPRKVWIDYMAIIRLRIGWEHRLDHYGIDTVVLDTLHREALINQLRRSENWRLEFEDDRAVIFTRQSSALSIFN